MGRGEEGREGGRMEGQKERKNVTNESTMKEKK